MFIVYSKEKISKVLFEVNLNKEDLDIVLGGDVYKDHPSVEKDKSIVIQQQYPYTHPTYDEKLDNIREMTLIEMYKNGLYSLKEHEVEYNGDIILLEEGQYINPEGILTTVPPIEGVKVEWNWETNIWEDNATIIEQIDAQYAEYSPMDTVSTVKEMEQLDPAMAEEFVNMLIELRNMKSTLSEGQSVRMSLHKPSEKLEKYKDKYLSIFGKK